MLRSLSTPALLALVTLLGVTNLIVTATTAQADGDDALVEDVQPRFIPVDSFLTGDEVTTEVVHEGASVHLERGEKDALEVVFRNPTDEGLTVAMSGTVIRTTGSMIGRMGPIPMEVATTEFSFVIPPDGEHRQPISDVVLTALPEVTDGLVAPNNLFLNFDTVELRLDTSARVVFSDAATF